jgi:hypothetical protein
LKVLTIPKSVTDWGGSFWRLQFLDLENSTLFEACKEPNLLLLQICLHICLCYHMFSNRSVQRFQALWPGHTWTRSGWSEVEGLYFAHLRETTFKSRFFKKLLTAFNTTTFDNIQQHSTTINNNQRQLSHMPNITWAPHVFSWCSMSSCVPLGTWVGTGFSILQCLDQPFL